MLTKSQNFSHEYHWKGLKKLDKGHLRVYSHFLYGTGIHLSKSCEFQRFFSKITIFNE